MNDRQRQIEIGPDLVLPNGAHVEVKTRIDSSGARVISELHIVFPKNKEVSTGGITARTLRDLPLEFLRLETGGPKRQLELAADQEERLLDLLRNYPSSPGRVPILPIYGAAIAYFYEKFLNEKPYKPNVALSSTLGTPVRTIATRVATARVNGFLESGQTPRSGGSARGALTPKAKDEILRWLRAGDFEYGAKK